MDTRGQIRADGKYEIVLGVTYKAKASATRIANRLVGKHEWIQHNDVLKNRFQGKVLVSPSMLEVFEDVDGRFRIRIAYTLKDVVVAIRGEDNGPKYVPYENICHWKSASEPPHEGFAPVCGRCGGEHMEEISPVGVTIDKKPIPDGCKIFECCDCDWLCFYTEKGFMWVGSYLHFDEGGRETYGKI